MSFLCDDAAELVWVLTSFFFHNCTSCSYCKKFNFKHKLCFTRQDAFVGKEKKNAEKVFAYSIFSYNNEKEINKKQILQPLKKAGYMRLIYRNNAAFYS